MGLSGHGSGNIEGVAAMKETADAIVFREGNLLLIQRGKEPYKGWELFSETSVNPPGGSANRRR